MLAAHCPNFYNHLLYLHSWSTNEKLAPVFINTVVNSNDKIVEALILFIFLFTESQPTIQPTNPKPETTQGMIFGLKIYDYYLCQLLLIWQDMFSIIKDM